MIRLPNEKKKKNGLKMSGKIKTIVPLSEQIEDCPSKTRIERK